jgi:hypothetical protein
VSRKVVQEKNLVLFGSVVLTLAAFLAAYQLILELRVLHDAKHGHPFLGQLQILLLLSFLMTAGGLAIRSRKGLVCSLLGLMGVLFGYLAWFLDSHERIQAIRLDKSYEQFPPLPIPPNIWGFLGARWWNIAFLALFIVLFVWEIKVLFTRVEKGNRNDVGS